AVQPGRCVVQRRRCAVHRPRRTAPRHRFDAGLQAYTNGLLPPEPLSERDWRDLLRLIHDHQVIPVVGPGLVTVVDPASGEQVPLHRHLAPALARGLGLENPESFVSWNDAARAHLLRGGKRGLVYDELLDQVKDAPSPALLALASITDFDLFISSTPDGLLAQALTRQRPGFSPKRDVIRFHPQA